MRFLQIYHSNDYFVKVRYCIGKNDGYSSVVKTLKNTYVYRPPGTDIYNSFYLEIIK